MEANRDRLPVPLPLSASGDDRRPLLRGSTVLWLAWLAVPLTVAIRLWFDATHAIVPDEGVYWTWSRHLAAGYLDHPPMIAFVIRLSTLLFGNTSLGVRFFAALLSGGSCAIILGLAGRLLRHDRAVAWSALLLLGSPLVVILGTIITPDTPAIFLSLSVIACVILATEDATRPNRSALLWMTAGLLTGLALLTKYTAVLVPFGVLCALLSSPAGRRQLRSPWPYLAGALAIFMFLPVVYWNSTHDWVSFRFQLNHGLATDVEAGGDKPRGLLVLLERMAGYIGGQLAVWNPVLMGIGVVALVANIRRYRSLPVSRHLLIWAAAMPLIFFGIASTRARGEINWPALAYFPMTLLIVEFALAPGTRRQAWLKIGASTAIVISIALNMPTTLVRMGIRPKKLDQLFGWPEFAAQLESKRRGLPVVCNMQREAGPVEFYLPAQPMVAIGSVGSRPTAFDYMDDVPPLRSFEQLVFVGDHVELFCKKYGFAKIERNSIRVPLETGRIRARALTYLTRLPLAEPANTQPFTLTPPTSKP